MECKRSILTTYFRDLEKKGQFSGGVLIAEAEEVILQDSYGYEKRERNTKNHKHSKYLIASITKSVTAMAMMILQERGILDVEDTIHKYIPDVPNGKNITIHHLLTHTAGLWQDEDILRSAKESRELDDLIDNLKDKEPAFTPGEKFDYSNIGYTLLVYILQRITKQSYETFIQENIFDPLGMINTGVYKDNTMVEHLATGYIKDNEKMIKADTLALSNFKGAGDLYSTIDDLYLWVKELSNPTILDDENHKKLMMDYGQVYENHHYGYGKIVYKEKNDIRYYYQDGSLPGYKSIYVVYPKESLTILYLSNYQFVNTPNIINDIGKILCNKDCIFQID